MNRSLISTDCPRKLNWLNCYQGSDLCCETSRQLPPIDVNNNYSISLSKYSISLNVRDTVSNGA